MLRLPAKTSPSQPKDRMIRVRSENTAPELAVRRLLHRAGLRFRLHARELPGTPDVVLPRRRSVVFVHGCFWHGHHCAHGSVQSKTNAEFWRRKVDGNRARDTRKEAVLRTAGWRVEVIWECQVKDEAVMRRLISRLLRR